MGQAMPRLDAIRQTGMTEHTYYRWKKYDGMGSVTLTFVRSWYKADIPAARMHVRNRP